MSAGRLRQGLLGRHRADYDFRSGQERRKSGTHLPMPLPALCGARIPVYCLHQQQARPEYGTHADPGVLG